VYQSTDDGADWSAIGIPLDPAALATTIEVAPSDAARIYVSAVRGTAGARTASLFVSVDGGADWIERPVALDPVNETAIYIAAIDPAHADLVYLRTAGNTSRLLVTSDAGRTFNEVLKLGGQLLGFALSPDGAKLYAGTAEQGLFVATRDSLSFHNTSPIHVLCLATRSTELWACSDEVSGFIAGVSTDDGATFKAKLHLMAQPLIACSADAAATSQCGGAVSQAFCQLLPGCDAGTARAAVAAPSGGCAVNGQASLGWAAGGALVVLAFCGCLRFAGVSRRGRARHG
jgi:hypothetical protein